MNQSQPSSSTWRSFSTKGTPGLSYTEEIRIIFWFILMSIDVDLIEVFKILWRWIIRLWTSRAVPPYEALPGRAGLSDL